MPDRHKVKIGDEIEVAGTLFIVTELKLVLNQPPVLIVEPPIGLLTHG